MEQQLGEEAQQNDGYFVSLTSWITGFFWGTSAEAEEPKETNPEQTVINRNRKDRYSLEDCAECGNTPWSRDPTRRMAQRLAVPLSRFLDRAMLVQALKWAIDTIRRKRYDLTTSLMVYRQDPELENQIRGEIDWNPESPEVIVARDGLKETDTWIERSLKMMGEKCQKCDRRFKSLDKQQQETLFADMLERELLLIEDRDVRLKTKRELARMIEAEMFKSSSSVCEWKSKRMFWYMSSRVDTSCDEAEEDTSREKKSSEGSEEGSKGDLSGHHSGKSSDSSVSDLKGREERDTEHQLV